MANTIAFKDSKTKENLMRAFAGESQARNRYTISAAAAKKNNLHVVETIFTFTADQEKEHAEIFWNLLKEMSGNNVEIDGSYPVEVFDNVLKLLRAAEHNRVHKACAKSNKVLQGDGDGDSEYISVKICFLSHKYTSLDSIQHYYFSIVVRPLQ